MLHLVSLSPLPPEVAERMAAEDDVVLQQGSIWAALKGHADNAKLSHLMAEGCFIYVLREILEVNGIDDTQILAGVNIIDYPGLVDLTVKNPVIHTWC